MSSPRAGSRAALKSIPYIATPVLVVILAGGVSARYPHELLSAAAADPGVIFESTWGTATGNSSNALTDGGRWPGYVQYDNPPAPLMSVVTGGPNGLNALRVQQRGPLYPTHVYKTNFIAQSTDYYLRYYFKTDDTSSSGDHIVTVGGSLALPPGENLTFMRKYGGSTDWRMTLSAYGCGNPIGYPLEHWGPGPRLANGQWFRLEYYVHFVDANHMQVHPRIYNASNALLYDDDDFRQQDWGATSFLWNGRNDWTLGSFYAAGHSFCVDPVVMNDFAMGNNGQALANDTGLFWYYAGVQVRSDTWPGPVGAATGDTTPPTVSLSAPASGATVSGSVTLTATASDDVGVAGVQFKVDGVNVGVEELVAPYSIPWDSTSAVNGSHSITAVARDAAGNQTTSAARTVTVSNTAPPPPAGGIASRYPSDVGIETDPDVIFVEKFEESTTSLLFGKYNDVHNPTTMTFSTDIASGSPTGSHSLNVSWTGGSNDGGHLYKVLSPGIDDKLYVRYYIKYPTSGKYRHEGIWVGGSNPVTNWPNPQAGIKPTGSDRFIAVAEQSDDSSHFDHYNYWMDMHVHGDGKYWGNMLLMDPNVDVPRGQWACIEHMVKLNNPVTAANGEHAIWINGVKVSHLGQGFPNGTWTWGNFTQTPSGSPFGGFRWRSDANLKLNWIWLQNYSPDDPAGFTSSLKFDHVVVAKNYIGCLSTAPLPPRSPLNVRVIR